MSLSPQNKALIARVVEATDVRIIERLYSDDVLNALLNAARSEASPLPLGWRPIETAPKDGRQIIALWPKGFQGYSRTIIDIVRWDRSEWVNGRDNACFAFALWHALPEPPPVSGDTHD